MIQLIDAAEEIDKIVNEKFKTQGWIIPGDVKVSTQVEFIKLLKERGAFSSIPCFLDSLDRPHVKAYTTACFALGSSRFHRKSTPIILDKMDQRGVKPTPLTFITVLRAIDGVTAAVSMMKRIDHYGVKMNAEVYNSVIFACQRSQQNGSFDDKSWQTTIRFVQEMKRKQIEPTAKTYEAVFKALAPTGKTKLADPFLQQFKLTPIIRKSHFVWAAAMNIFANAADWNQIIILISEMQDFGCQPNLLHCSALLKACVRAKESSLAIDILETMIGKSIDNSVNLNLPTIMPDLVALNTVISACSRGGDFANAKSIFLRIKAGEFIDPVTHETISPDRITYHTMLSSTNDPHEALRILKEVVFESTEADCDKMCLRAILKACSQSSPPRWLEATTIYMPATS